MPTNEYHFITHWRLRATLEEVARILADGADLARWWPSVYLDVQELAPGDSTGVGKEISLYTKGWLPYTLRWTFHITDVRADGFTIEAHGDFIGRGIWTFTQDGPDALITYDWKISAEKPLLRSLSWLMKPIFAANHRWAMARGEESLKLELLRRRARTEAERARIPPPPPATTSSSVLLLLGVLAIVGASVMVIRRRMKN